MAEAHATKGIALSHDTPSAPSLRIAIVHTQWNAEVVGSLVEGARGELLRQGVRPESITVVEVPGAYELALGAKCLVASGTAPRPDAVIAVGCLIKGATMHFEYIAEAATQGIMRVGLDSGVPVIFGLLCCLTEEQARERAGLVPGKHNHGVEWAQSALTMAALSTKHALAAFFQAT